MSRQSTLRCLPLLAVCTIAACSFDTLPLQAPDFLLPAADFAPVFNEVDGAVPLDLAVDLCANGVRDNGESDVDCGGPNCAACGNGKSCTVDADCVNKSCLLGTCASMTPCKDGLKDGFETDIDCGGASCAHCGLGRACRTEQDCASGLCSYSHCTAPKALAPDFAAPSFCPTGPGPLNVAVGNWNGDGRTDMAAPSTKGPITLCLGVGDGTFRAPTSIAANPTVDIWSADFNRDGKQDLAVRYVDGDGVGVFRGRATAPSIRRVLHQLRPQSTRARCPWGI